MEVMEAIRSRRSVRAYTDTPVSREQLACFLEAVQLAPSWKNRQCCRVLVLTDRKQILRLGELLRGNPAPSVFETAPYFIVVTADPAQSGVRDDKPYYMTNAGIALQNGVLAAEAMGLGTCWIGAFTEAPIKEFLGIPESVRIVAFSPLGVPAECPEARPRKPLSELAFENTWGTPLS